MNSFSAKIQIIGVNPYVLLPGKVLKEVFRKAGKEKGPIPVCGTINNEKYSQTLVKYCGRWRLYLNTPMRKSAGIEVGDIAKVKVNYDPSERLTPMHPKLKSALEKNKKALEHFNSLSPSRKKEIMRYINALKTEETINKNIIRAIGFLSGIGKFAGRDNQF